MSDDDNTIEKPDYVKLTKYLAQGLTLTPAVDYWMVNDVGMSPETWADFRGVTIKAMDWSLESAKQTLSDKQAMFDEVANE